MHSIVLFIPMCTWIRSKDKFQKLESHEKKSEVITMATDCSWLQLLTQDGEIATIYRQHHCKNPRILGASWSTPLDHKTKQDYIRKVRRQASLWPYCPSPIWIRHCTERGPPPQHTHHDFSSGKRESKVSNCILQHCWRLRERFTQDLPHRFHWGKSIELDNW